MPKTPEEQALWEAIKRNSRLDNLVTYYLQSDEAEELLAKEQKREEQE